MKKTLYLLCCLVFMMLPVACINEEIPLGEDIVKVGDLLPDLSVTMNDGESVTSASLREGASVVVFFHSSCPDCRSVLPSLQRLYDDHANGSVRFVLISREESASTIEAYWQSCGYTMPYSAQEDRWVYELFATSRVPRVYISGMNGRVAHIFTDNPVPTYDQLKQALLDIL